MIQPLFKETNNNGPTTVYKRQLSHSTSVFLRACFHPFLHAFYTLVSTMNLEQEQRLLAPVDVDEDKFKPSESATVQFAQRQILLLFLLYFSLISFFVS